MKEKDIRKRETFDKFIGLVEKDAGSMLKTGSFVKVNCPACGSAKLTYEFEKFSFKFVSCKECATLFVSPRPDFSALSDFYSKSRSMDFWMREFFMPFLEMRRKKIFKPRAEYASRILKGRKGLHVGDIGAGFGLFLEEVMKTLPGNHYTAIEPSRDMSDICRQKKLDVKCAYLEDLNHTDTKFDFLTSFELIEHLFDPGVFLKKVYSLLKPGGSFLLTALNGKGFDILLLWDKFKNILPPQHLNFFNPSSISCLLERLGFELVEVATPGKLDWDIVEGMIRNDGVRPGRFWEYFERKGSPESKKELQKWISKNNLSSHMRILAKKPCSEEK